MKGFTLVELLIAIGISVMLTALTFSYTNIGKNQVALSVEGAKVAQSVLFAKNLAVATYHTVPGTCGYGVYVNAANNTYSIFAFVPSTSTKPAYAGDASPFCPSLSSTISAGITVDGAIPEIVPYSPASWNVPLASGVDFTSAPADSADVTLMTAWTCSAPCVRYWFWNT